MVGNLSQSIAGGCGLEYNSRVCAQFGASGREIVNTQSARGWPVREKESDKKGQMKVIQEACRCLHWYSPHKLHTTLSFGWLEHSPPGRDQMVYYFLQTVAVITWIWVDDKLLWPS